MPEGKVQLDKYTLYVDVKLFLFLCLTSVTTVPSCLINQDEYLICGHLHTLNLNSLTSKQFWVGELASVRLLCLLFQLSDEAVVTPLQ